MNFRISLIFVVTLIFFGLHGAKAQTLEDVVNKLNIAAELDDFNMPATQDDINMLAAHDVVAVNRFINDSSLQREIADEIAKEVGNIRISFDAQMWSPDNIDEECKDFSKNLNAYADSKPVKPVKGITVTPVDAVEPIKYKYKVNVLDLMESGVTLKEIPPALKPTHMLFIPEKNVVRERYKDKITDDEQFERFYAEMYDYVRGVNDAKAKGNITYNRRHVDLLTIGDYKRFSPYPVKIWEGIPKYGSGLTGYPLLFSDEQIASRGGKHYMYDDVSKTWTQKETTGWDKLTKNLVLQYDEEGNPFWEEQQYGQLYGSQQVMSIFGPRRAHANPFIYYPLKIVTATTTELMSSVFKLFGLAEYAIGKHIFGAPDELAMLAAANYWTVSNWLDKFTIKSTEVASNTRWQELYQPWHRNNKFTDFAFELCSLIGMVNPLIAAAQVLTLLFLIL